MRQMKLIVYLCLYISEPSWQDTALPPHNHLADLGVYTSEVLYLALIAQKQHADLRFNVPEVGCSFTDFLFQRSWFRDSYSFSYVRSSLRTSDLIPQQLAEQCIALERVHPY